MRIQHLMAILGLLAIVEGGLLFLMPEPGQWLCMWMLLPTAAMLLLAAADRALAIGRIPLRRLSPGTARTFILVTTSAAVMVVADSAFVISIGMTANGSAWTGQMWLPLLLTGTVGLVFTSVGIVRMYSSSPVPRGDDLFREPDAFAKPRLADEAHREPDAFAKPRLADGAHRAHRKMFARQRPGAGATSLLIALVAGTVLPLASACMRVWLLLISLFFSGI